MANAATFLTALYTVVTILSATPNLNNPPAFAIRFLVFHGGVNMALEYMSLSTTACAQIFSTALIAWKAWYATLVET